MMGFWSVYEAYKAVFDQLGVKRKKLIALNFPYTIVAISGVPHHKKTVVG